MRALGRLDLLLAGRSSSPGNGTLPQGGTATAELIDGAPQPAVSLQDGPIDSVSYVGCELSPVGSGITITLDSTSAAFNDGAVDRGDGKGKGDRVVGIEQVIGSGRADSITGTSVAGRLDGGFGNDRIEAKGGNDQLIGGDGLDRDDIEGATGGTGGDKIVGNNADNRLDGGGGLDAIKAFDGDDVIMLRVVPLVCPRAAGGICRGTAEVRRAGVLVGRTSYRVASGGRRSVRVKLKRRLPAGASVQVIARTRDSRGRPRTSTARRRVA